MSKVEYTMSGATRFGKMSTKMIRRSLAPSDRAASTNSFSRRESVWPRMIRPTTAQLKKAITAIDTIRLGPTIDTSAIANSRRGNERITSMKRESAVSTTVPKYPATMPTIPPTMTARPLATTPAISEIRVPYATRTRTSRPRSSAPNRNVRLGPAGKPNEFRAVNGYWSPGPCPIRCAITGAKMATRVMKRMTIAEAMANRS